KITIKKPKLKTATNKNNQNSPKRGVFLFLGGPLFNDQTGPPLYAHYQDACSSWSGMKTPPFDILFTY
ncbi:MAG: hypothetical protein NT142_18400, partial [Planctomycetota bacterium]|nr:hypothetical protein [Planctomycetota bacterium]